MAQLRANDPGLTELNLARKGVGPQGALALAEELKANTVLVKLDLSGCGLGDAAASTALPFGPTRLAARIIRGRWRASAFVLHSRCRRHTAALRLEGQPDDLLALRVLDDVRHAASILPSIG